MIYFDNAATTFPKPKEVIKEAFDCLRHYCGNAGRSSFGISLKASEKIYETRDTIADFINFYDPARVIFTHNATHALNIAIKGEINTRSHVIISDLEHNSVLRPLYKSVSRYGGEISVFDSDLPIKEALIPLLKDDTRLIICSLASNVTGKMPDYIELYKIAKSKNIKIILDASQYFGHKEFNYRDCPADYIISSGHKSLFGLQGSGILLLGNKSFPDTLIEGGNGYDSLNRGMGELVPEKYEAGTVAAPSIIGLGAGIRYLKEISLKSVEEKLYTLTQKTLSILDSFKAVDVLGFGGGIISFNFKSTPSNVISEDLSKYGIITRSGVHCAPLIHNKLGTSKTGTVRISFSYLNRLSELDKLYKALKNINMTI